MKQTFFFMLIYFTMVNSNGFCEPIDIDVGVNKEVSLYGDRLKIKLLRIVEDKRCPKGFKCYWSGYVKVEILVAVDKIDYGRHFLADINNEMYNLSNVITVADYRIKLDSNGVLPASPITPNANSPNGVSPQNYVIRLQVSEAD